MNIMAILFKFASFLIVLSIGTVVLTFVQPMHPEVDKWFRVGAGITFIVSIGIILAIYAIVNKKAEKTSSDESPEGSWMIKESSPEETSKD